MISKEELAKIATKKRIEKTKEKRALEKQKIDELQEQVKNTIPVLEKRLEGLLLKAAAEGGYVLRYVPHSSDPYKTADYTVLHNLSKTGYRITYEQETDFDDDGYKDTVSVAYIRWG